MLARVSSLSLFPAYGVGVTGYAIDGPLAAAFGPSAVFAVGAAYGLLSSAAVLALRSVRTVAWHDRAAEPGTAGARAAEPIPAGARAAEPAPEISASAPPREGRRRRPAAPPP